MERDMRYSQIKHKVIDTTDLVSKVTPNIMPSFSDRYLIPPTYLVGNYISRQRERLGVYPLPSGGVSQAGGRPL